ncbi:hypothetical protein STEG23_025342, partial [Scotinomys teguina]
LQPEDFICALFSLLGSWPPRVQTTSYSQLVPDTLHSSDSDEQVLISCYRMTLKAFIAPASTMRARPREVDFQVSYNLISPSPVTKMHKTFNNRVLPIEFVQSHTVVYEQVKARISVLNPYAKSLWRVERKCPPPKVALLEGIWTLILGVWKAVEFFKHCLRSHTGRSVEDSGAECDLMNCGDQEVSEEKNVDVRAGDSLGIGFLSVALILCMVASLDQNDIPLATLKVSFKSEKKLDKDFISLDMFVHLEGLEQCLTQVVNSQKAPPIPAAGSFLDVKSK